MQWSFLFYDPTSMLSVEQCKKILGGKAKNYSDEFVEAARDELYIVANLAFSHWQKNCSSTKGDDKSSLVVGEQPKSDQSNSHTPTL